ncbi:hypothetical protein O6H91_02G076000 [Diphasiastrum complanatum]|uniref:Uncharacterized protein n=1 Tax=Diphasiastrum complanatum TaxID=34168 RepID=A0ACC2EH08_DIPCM|nr:hypothetical protein O6H91_02G076000 [Diphasiastrum complanatum]
MAWEELPVSVPTHFRCPISLDLMKDPVSLCTGVTYDRSSIIRWLEAGHNTCPATMQTLTNPDLTPNHTLRRLIQRWSASNASKLEVARVTEPRQPLDRDQVDILLQDAKKEATKVESMRKLRAKAKESSKNCRCIAESGAVPALLSVLGSCNLDDSTCNARETDACEAIVGTLALVPVDYATKRTIASPKNLSIVSWVLSRGSMDARINAAVLLESLAVDRELKLRVGSTAEVFEGLVELLKENLNQMAVKASLRSFLALCMTRRNRVLAVNAGAIAALIELLPDVASITGEYALAVLEMLCKCAEGRAAFNEHALAIPTVAYKICHVSDVASEYAVGILWGICKHCGEESVQNCLVEAGVLAKLLLLLQLDFNATTKHKMTEFLKLLKNISRRYPRTCNLDEARYIAIGHFSSYDNVTGNFPHITKKAKLPVPLPAKQH